MALSTGALTSVAQVQALGVDKTVFQAGHTPLVEFLIESYSDTIEQYLGRVLARASYVEKYVGHGRQLLLLKQWPIVSVTYMKDDGATIPVTEYEVMAQEGMLFREAGWSGGALELRTLALGEVHPSAVRYNLEASYMAGYITPNMIGTRDLPYDLEFACARLAFAAFLNRDKEGMTRLSSEGWSSDFDRWPLDVVRILNAYKREG